jgi:hypothetical protein
MRPRIALSVWFLSLQITGCAHGPCRALGSLFGCACVSKTAQPEYQDLSIQLPMFNYDLPLDTDLDGYTLQAIRIAANDFLEPDPAGLPCESKQASHRYRALRQGEVIFVRIDYKPENCGQSVRMLDAGATYAISVDGRILRREKDGLGPW